MNSGSYQIPTSDEQAMQRAREVLNACRGARRKPRVDTDNDSFIEVKEIMP
jgi:hypothetical protein